MLVATGLSAEPPRKRTAEADGKGQYECHYLEEFAVAQC
jgi:hypothetical protein